MPRYLAVVDDRHGFLDPVTVIRVVDGAGPRGGNDWARLLPADAATVQRFIDAHQPR